MKDGGKRRKLNGPTPAGPNPHIVADSTISPRKAMFKGTRLMVWQAAEPVAEGHSGELIWSARSVCCMPLAVMGEAAKPAGKLSQAGMLRRETALRKTPGADA